MIKGTGFTDPESRGYNDGLYGREPKCFDDPYYEGFVQGREDLAAREEWEALLAQEERDQTISLTIQEIDRWGDFHPDPTTTLPITDQFNFLNSG